MSDQATVAVAGAPNAAAASTQPPSADAAAASAGTQPAQTPPAAKPAESVKYEFKVPEGYSVDKDWLEKTAAFARERGLSAEQAQAVLEREALAVQQHSDARNSEVKSIVEGWAAEAQNDKEIGGVNFSRSAEDAKRVVDRFGTDAFKEALNESGLGNHPELIRVFARIGRLMREDVTVLGGNKPSTPARSPAEILYTATSK